MADVHCFAEQIPSRVSATHHQGAGFPMSTPDLPDTAVSMLAEFVGSRPGAEHRPQQQVMVGEVARALDEDVNLVVQAGTGTGKTFAYLVGAVAANKKVVISTATKALGEQLAEQDVPLVESFMRSRNRSITTAMVKGRSNYACLNKINEAAGDTDDAGDSGEDDADADLFGGNITAEREHGPSQGDLAEYRELLEWVQNTTTGDRSDGPATGSWAWNQISVSPAQCVGAANCAFAEDCFSEKARNDAREADIAITNHALLAADMANGDSLFGEAQAIVVDEVHEFERVLSDAWGAVVDPVALSKDLRSVARLVRHTDDGRDVVDSLLADLTELSDRFDALEPGRLPELPTADALLIQGIHTKGLRLYGIAAKEAESGSGSDVGRARGVLQTLTDHLDAMSTALNDDGTYVRWIQMGPWGNAIIKAAPLNVGPMLMSRLGNRTLIATSATCTVGGSFDRIVEVLGLPLSTTTHGEEVAVRPYRTADVGTPYDWASSAMLYVPDAPFPEPVGASRTEHSAAVLDEVTALVQAAGGRTLVLSTTTAGARRIAEHLREQVPVNVYAHGEATAGQLTDAFINDETSVLCATMGHFAGVNATGVSCSQVIIDKIPFPHADDPLSAARSEAVDAAGGSGFMAVAVTHAALMLAQGAGRLIRTANDKGVIAVLDPRLISKRYGTTLRQTLPPVNVYRDRTAVTTALTRLTGGMPDPRDVPAPHVEGGSTRPRSASSGRSASTRGAVTRAKPGQKTMLTQVKPRPRPQRPKRTG